MPVTLMSLMPLIMPRRQRTPFLINCVAADVFTVVWVAIVVRETLNCDPDTMYCW